MKNNFLLFLLPALLLFGSCSQLQIEKRKYQPGFYVHTSGHKTTGAEKSEPLPVANAQAGTPTNMQQSAVLPDESKTEPAENNFHASSKGFAQKKPLVKTPAAVREFPVQKTNAVKSPLTKSPAADDDSVLMLILLIILCIFIPPLAVYLKEGFTKRCLVILVLWLLAVVFGFFFFGALGLLGLIAFLWALLIILDVL